MYDYLIVGAGFAGAVTAERLANESRQSVLVIDGRNHVGGNAYDSYDSSGILIHQYGPHIFHTNSDVIFRYLSQFTEWRHYEHRVLTNVNGKLLPFPINIDTINGYFGFQLDEDGVRQYLARVVEHCNQVRTSEDLIVSTVGRDLYNLFFRNYTRKQWGCEPSDLDASVAGRVPLRLNHDDRYFTDKYQMMPKDGYTPMFKRMLTSPRIDLALNTDFLSVRQSNCFRKLVYTGPIDEYFDMTLGKLPYRSLRFEHCTVPKPRFQPVATVNFPNEHAYTRITEFKHITGQRAEKSSVVYEFPVQEGHPYYPIPRPANEVLFQRYWELAKKEKNVRFIGRLATYKYLNMDQVVGQALHAHSQIAACELA